MKYKQPARQEVGYSAAGGSDGGDGRRTGVVGEGVEDGDQVVQAGPVVGVTVQPLLEGVAGQGDTHEPQGHLPDLVPHVDVGGVQHDGLEGNQEAQT